MAAHAAASQPKGSDHLGTDDAAGERLASGTNHPTSLAERSLRRHTPEVGAVCGKAARTVLCGGREVTRVPTASIAVCCTAYVAYWHIASIRCGAKVRTRSERSGHAESVGSGSI
jgi:hypothetical protein